LKLYYKAQQVQQCVPQLVALRAKRLCSGGTAQRLLPSLALCRRHSPRARVQHNL
jgi:hypothetical protein